jgi:DNA repair exonuclease SbcCD ATPase subunit
MRIYKGIINTIKDHIEWEKRLRKIEEIILSVNGIDNLVAENEQLEAEVERLRELQAGTSKMWEDEVNAHIDTKAKLAALQAQIDEAEVWWAREVYGVYKNIHPYEHWIDEKIKMKGGEKFPIRILRDEESEG